MSASADLDLPAAQARISEAVDTALTACQIDCEPPWEQTRAVLAAIGRGGGFRACLGAAGLSLGGLRALIQRLATRAPSGVTLAACVQTALFTPIMAALASEAQRPVLAEVLDGEAVGGVAVTDLDVAGSDLTALTTTLRPCGDGWLLNGAKDWVTGACLARYLLVCARTGAGRHFSNFSLVLVPTELDGVLVRPRDTAVMRHAGIGTAGFTDVKLPAGALVGRPGRGVAYFLRYVTTERLAGGFWATAVGHDVIGRTAAWLRHREIAGGTLWDNPAVRHQLAEAAVGIRLIEALADDITRRCPVAPPPAPDTAALKAALAPNLTSALTTCVQLHGAAGLTSELGLLELLTDTRAFGVAGGSTQTMLDLVAHSDLVLGS